MQPTKEELVVSGAENLAFLEQQTLAFLGLPLFKILAYELVQLLNHTYLAERLGHATDDVSA